MTNQYYNPTGNPQPNSRGSSALVDQEFVGVGAAFNLLPAPATLTGDAQGYAVDTGASGALVVPLPPNITAVYDGMKIVVKAAYACPGPSTIAIGALVAVPINRADGTLLQPGDFAASQIAEFRYSATTGTFQLSTTGISSSSAAQASAASALASQQACSASLATANSLKLTAVVSFYQNFGAF